VKILIVGAGAVGLVYAHHFSNAGHQVTFLVKEKYQQTLEADKQKGVVLYHLNKDKHLQSPVRFTSFTTITEWNDADGFDLIALSISSNALRQLPLSIINDKIESSMNVASLLMLHPSEEDLAYLTTVIAKEHILQGMITLISYQTDYINEGIKPVGTAYYLPALPMPISISQPLLPQTQDNLKLKQIIMLFNQSGIKAKAVNSTLDDSQLISAFLITFLCVLEAAEWQFERLKNSKKLLHKLSAAQAELLPQKMIANGVLAPFKKRLLTALIKY
jgi:ketopantoate reductase